MAEMNSDKMLGFCPHCMQNVEHTRKFSSWIPWILDQLTLKFIRIFRLGPFYCFQCEQKTLYLKPMRRDAPIFNSETSGINFRSQRKRESSDQNRKSDANPEAPIAQPVGNYIKSEHSLVLQERRAKNFSGKFRDAAVQRILTGTTTIQDVKHELDVNESDIVRWIADLLGRQQKKIDELKAILNQVKSQLPTHLQARLESSVDQAFSETNQIVDGKVD